MTTWERVKYEILLPIPVVVILALLLVLSFSKLFLQWPPGLTNDLPVESSYE